MNRPRNIFVSTIITTFFFLLFIGVSVCEVLAAPPSDKNWEMIWNDEFEGNTLDSTKWSHIAPNDPQPRKTGYWDKQDAYLNGNGELVLRTRKVEEGVYHSGAIRTRDLFEHTYGYYEARIKLPTQRGHWPGFWLLNPYVWYEPCSPWDDNPGLDPWGVQKTCGTEIDIVELPILEHGYYHTVWWYDDATNSHKSYSYEKKDLEQEVLDPNAYHVFGLEWNDTEYVFYVDGQQTARFTESDNNVSISHVEEYIKLTEEVDWDNPEIAGDIRTVTGFTEDYTYVDYVRVYDLVVSTPTPTPIPTPISTSTPNLYRSDFQLDMKADLIDYQIFLTDYRNFLSEEATLYEKTDINQDGAVNILDYTLFIHDYIDFITL